MKFCLNIYIYPWNISRRWKSKIETNVKVGENLQNHMRRIIHELLLSKLFTIPLNLPPKFLFHPVYADKLKKKNYVFFDSFN